jgi:ATP-dependent RNA helicase DDX3X
MLQARKVSLSNVLFFCLDEADRMLDLGFEKELRMIAEQSDLRKPANRQTLMFSATMPKQIKKLASDFLNDYVLCRVGQMGSIATIKQIIKLVEGHQKRDQLLRELRAGNNANQLTISKKKRRS